MRTLLLRWLRVSLAAFAACMGFAAPVAGQFGGFDDVSDDAYYSLPVTALAGRGVFGGTLCDDGFCPGEPIDRRTMAVWTVRVLDGRDPPAVTGSRFDDVDAAGFHAPFIERMAALGVTAGCGDGSGFCPDRHVTRAQMAVFLSRAYRLPAGPDPMFSDVPDDAWYASDVAKLAASGITVGCGDGTGFCPGRDTTRAQMAAFLFRAVTAPPPTLTPEEAAHVELSQLLPWYDDPPYPTAALTFVEVWLRAPDLGRDLAQASWVVDGITAPLEHNAPYGLGNLYDHDPALARRMLAYSTEEPVRTPNIHLLNVLGDMARDDPASLELLQAQGWFADGLSPEERAFVVVLGKVAYHDALYADLLAERFTLEATVELPLSGETVLWAFGPDPVEGDVLTAMEDGARAAERVMASPLPVTDLIMLQVNPERYGGGSGGVHTGDSMVLSTQSGLVDAAHADLLYHEVAHYYLTHEIGPFWLVEGGADFVLAYRQAWDGTEDWGGRVPLREGNEYWGRRWCRDNGVPNAAALADADPEFVYVCSYHLGEYLLTHLYNTIGEAAFSSAMAELYRSYTRFQFYPGEEQVYRVFLKHTPPDREEAFLDVYRRFHGGPFVDGG